MAVSAYTYAYAMIILIIIAMTIVLILITTFVKTILCVLRSYKRVNTHSVGSKNCLRGAQAKQDFEIKVDVFQSISQDRLPYQESVAHSTWKFVTFDHNN